MSRSQSFRSGVGFRSIWWLLMGLVLILPVSRPGFAQKPEKDYAKLLAESPIRSADYWGTAWKEQPLADRLAPAPQKLIDYLCLDNESMGFDEQPLAAEVKPVFKRVVEQLLAEFSAPVRKMIEDYIIGIFFATDLGSTGYTEVVTDDMGRFRDAFIVLDPDILLKRTANDWATWKENSFFAEDDSRIKLALTIEDPDGDKVENAIRFILLHEIGHVLGMADGLHPSWNVPLGGRAVEYPFVRLGWEWSKDNLISRYLDSFPEQPMVRAYHFDRSKLPGRRIPETYRDLMKTSYPSLQAASTVFEDFAESFATYHHVVRTGRTWHVRVEDEAGRIIRMDSPWYDERTAERRVFMEKWFAGGSGCRGPQ